MASGQWETVSKPNKKTKSSGIPLTKSQKKNAQDTMPRIDTAAPVKEDPTIYDAFVEKETQQTTLPGVDSKKSPTPSNKLKHKPADKNGKIPTKSLDEAFSSIHVSDLETILTKDQALFPENPSVWLKDLASVLNLKFEHVEENDPVFSDQPADFPSCKVTKAVRSLLNKTLVQCNPATLTIFYDHCIHSMVNDISKGAPTYGYRIFIQLIAYLKPEITVQNAEKTIELLHSHQNRPLRSLSIMWAAGQCAAKNLKHGLKVWLKVMLPMLKLRSYQTYTVEYLEKLFSCHGNLKSATDVISFRDFFPIFDVVFASNSGLPKHLQKKLLTLYPKLKDIAFGDNPSTSLRHFFPSFLARATPTCSEPMKTESLNSLVHCLFTDKHCYSIWRQVYTKQILQSSVLLTHMNSHWFKVKKGLDLKITKDTVRAFSITNEEMMSHGKGQTDGFEQCDNACKGCEELKRFFLAQNNTLITELLLKLEKNSFPWFLVFLSIFVGLFSLVAYDVYNRGHFKESRTAEILSHVGMLPVAEHLLSKMSFYSGKVTVWLQENVPYYYSKVSEVVGPYLQIIWQNLQHFWSWLVEVTKSQREWIRENLPIWLEQIQSHWFWVWMIERLSIVWLYVTQFSLWLWSYIVYLAQVTGTWLQENVLTEHSYSTLVSILSSLQQYFQMFLSWLTHLVTISEEKESYMLWY